MTTTSHPDREELMAWLDGEVPASREPEIRRHLDGCASCAACVGELRATTAALAGWSVDAPPPALAARLSEAASRSRQGAKPTAAARVGRARWRWAALAALVLVGVSVPLGTQCVEARGICRLTGVRHLFWAAPAPAAVGPIARPAGDGSVVVTMFIDWQCPACRAAHQAYAAMIDELARSAPGAVTFVVKDFPLNSACNAGVSIALHTSACEAAVAVRLAREKGREHEMVQWLFANQESLTPDGVKAALASLTGATDFDGRYAEEIEKVRADANEGVGLHVQFTPSCYLNGVLTNQPDGRWLPADGMRRLIDVELARAGGVTRR